VNKQQFNQLGLSLTIIFISISFFVLALGWQKLPPQSPLFYSLPWGEKQLATSKSLVLLPFLSLMILGFNYGFARILKETGLLLTLTLWTAAIFSFLSFFTLIKIVLLII